MSTKKKFSAEEFVHALTLEIDKCDTVDRIVFLRISDATMRKFTKNRTLDLPDQNEVRNLLIAKYPDVSVDLYVYSMSGVTILIDRTV